jgi:hypothetical protein
MEWTPEAIKAEIEYRQGTMLADAEHVRAVRRSQGPKRSWWSRLGHRPRPDIPEQRKGERDAA